MLFLRQGGNIKVVVLPFLGRKELIPRQYSIVEG